MFDIYIGFAAFANLASNATSLGIEPDSTAALSWVTQRPLEDRSL